MLRPVLVICLGIFCCTQTNAAIVTINLLGKLDAVEEHQADPQKRLTAKYHILQMMADCEFEEQCILKMKDRLEMLYNQDKNVMYKAFQKYLDWEKHDLEYNLKHCQLDEKKSMRKIYAQCYEAWIEEERQYPSENRHAIDVKLDKRYHCIHEKAEPLAQQGNIFAQAEMVNLAEYFKNPQEMSKWTAKIETLQGSTKFEQYMKCSELP